MGRRYRPWAVLALLTAVGLTAAPAEAAEPEWNVARVGAPSPAPGVVVAVVDTGVDASHPTFGGRVLPPIDLVDGAGGDPHGHGTHVAGIVGGGDSGPVIGVAPAITILPVRVLAADGQGSMSTVADGIVKAADAGARVINLSLSDDVVIRNLTGSSLSDAIHYAWSHGAICVLAAGNGGLLGGLLGSGYGSVPAVVVTATGSDDRLASYATGIGSARWGIAAPGGDGTSDGLNVLSSVPGGNYALMAGTSMSASHVSGALAALRARGLDPTQAVERLLGTARPIGPRSTYGAGLVDIAAATAGLSLPGGGGGVGTTTTDTAAPTTASPTTEAPPAASTTRQSQAPVVTAPTSTDTTAAPTTSAAPTEPLDAAGRVVTPVPTPDSPGNDPDGVPAGLALAAVVVCALAWAAAIRTFIFSTS